MPGYIARDTIYFDGSHWVCVFEKEEQGQFRACRVVFGKEPTGNDFLQYICKYGAILPFGPAVRTNEATVVQQINPKRLQRLAANASRQTGVSTKSQQALSQARVEKKHEKLSSKRASRIELQQIRRSARKLKYIRKHRGK